MHFTASLLEQALDLGYWALLSGLTYERPTWCWLETGRANMEDERLVVTIFLKGYNLEVDPKCHGRPPIS